MIFYRSLTTHIIWKIKLDNMSKPWTKEGRRKKRKYKKINSLVYIVMIQSSRSATNDRCVGEKEETGRACLKLKYFLIPKTADNSLLLFYYSFGFIFFNFHTRKHSMLPNLCCFALVITHALFLFPSLTHSHSSFFDLYPICFCFCLYP